VRQKSARLA